jgi:sulfonate transport system ATP-binding protein
MNSLAAATNTHPVRVTSVRRTFGARTVLGGIDLTIGHGEFVALLGRSGSGKSTLLRILAGLDEEYGGTVVVPKRRSVVFQEPNLLPWARVLPNVALGLRDPDVSGRARTALDEVGLSGHERAWPLTLSGGEAQRVALARALVRDPALLLLDEPFGALDALTRIKMHGLLAQLCERHRPAVLLVTHDVDEAIVLADRVLVLGPDGHICFNREVEIARPRRRGAPSFGALRTVLLNELGVDESRESG